VTALRVAELETLFTANLDPIAKAEKTVKETGKRIESKPIKQKVDADAKGALASMDRVEESAKRIVTAKTMATVDANIDRAEKNFMKVFERLDYLKSVRANVDVEADIKRAEANLSKIERSLDGLRSARATMEVDADTSGADAAFDEVRSSAGAAGEDAGEDLGDGIMAALLSIPIAGAVVGLGVAAGKALVQGLEDGMQIEVGFDRLAALTGLDQADALRLGRAAGEAYANVFGESIEANMDTARLALQLDLIDDDATTHDAQVVIEGLSGISDVLGEDVLPVARAVAQMLRTGIAKDSKQAFDILAAGAREGVNVNEDLLDTFNEYSTQFRKLGLDGPQALGLLSQAMKGGARDSDVAADSLKEFAIRATDPAMKKSFEDVGFSWDDLSQRIARGGPDAAAALDETLDKLRAIEDPVQRDAAAVALFGTKAEDMGAALSSMDLSSAVEQLGGVEGAAQRMFDTLADNDATKMEQAKRNIEVAVQGIQGALAAGFSEPLGMAADWVSQNRGPIMQFLLGLVDGALDFGDAVIDAAADGTEAFGEFVAGPLADVLEGFGAIMNFLGQEDASNAIGEMVAGMRDFDDTTSETADRIRGLHDGIDVAREKIHEFADPAVALGFLNDASLQLADSIDRIGNGSANAADQAGAAIDALNAQIDAASTAGESQEDLKQRYADGTQAIVDQLVAIGWNEEAARRLVDQYARVPAQVVTTFVADTTPAIIAVGRFLRDYSGRRITVDVGASGQRYSRDGGRTWYGDRGGILDLQYMAAGGLTPMRPEATMVPPNTWRVVGDRMDVSEAYIPMDGSPRSMAILLEAMRRMGVQPMGDGGVTASAAAPREITQINHFPPDPDPQLVAAAARADLAELLRGS